MNNITKYNLKTCVISALGLILLFSGLAYAMAPQTDSFECALGFGLGVPVWLSLLVLGVISAFIFMVLLWIARKVVK